MAQKYHGVNITKVLDDNVDYDIGLDIGTNSVGWAVVDSEGRLLQRKGKNTWGTRLFDEAKTAADTRTKRTLRRRYDRRKQRIYNLRELIASDVAAVDKDFFAKFNQTSLLPKDRHIDDKHILFDEETYSELLLTCDSELSTSSINKYPSIYHLRKRLVEDNSQEDIRLVYLALHHIIKYRGHFLIDGELTAKSANGKDALDALRDNLIDYCAEREISFDSTSFDVEKLNDILVQSSQSRRMRQEAFADVLLNCFEREDKDYAKLLSKAIFGYETNWDKLFGIDANPDTKFSLAKDEKVSKFEAELLPENAASIFATIQLVYNAYLLAGILKGSNGGTLSASMVELYNQHKQDLAWLKKIVKTYGSHDPKTNVNKDYYSLFRGAKYADGTYVKASAKGYTGYIEGNVPLDELYKQIKTTVTPYPLSSEEALYWQQIQLRMEDGTFLRKLRTSDNGAIPHQLHLEELRIILANQGKYYTSLRENAQKIEQILSFRIPYYVGPLGKEINPKRNKPFAWAKRRPEHEFTKIKPWNIEEVIDFDQAAEDFITNLTGECTYYYGMPVIPKYSLLYSEFCVRQELNKCRIEYDGEKPSKIDVELAEDIYQNIFKHHARVKVDTVQEFLKERGMINTGFRGTQKEGEFASSLKSYCDFTKILGHEINSFEEYEMVEQLILWVTVYEDKTILKRKINQTYGAQGTGVLSDNQVKQILRLRYTGWSNLSKEFLTELKVEYNGRKLSIMGALRDSGELYPMNLMEVLASKKFGFQKLLDEKNEEYLNAHKDFALENIPGSPAIKRGINQSLKIIDEIVKITGKQPRRIVVEMAREDVGKGKGRRTNPRAKQLESLYANLQKDILLDDSPIVDKELRTYSDKLDNDRLFLYFLQRGKCLYCGKPLSVEQLSSYHIDHIVPQSMIKDDSLDNRVLVCQHCNEEKLDQYPLPVSIRQKRHSAWVAYKNAGLISKNKFNKLTQSEVDTRALDGMAHGFINRQLVETRQISKHVVNLLQARYEESSVETVKAALSHQLRETYDLPKVRELNDWHHAHDAYLACQMSRFIHERFDTIAQDLNYRTFSKYAYAVRQKTKSDTGLIVNSFKFNGSEIQNNSVFNDAWDGSAELERLQTVLDYKDCFVSHKLERLKGEFWNQTVYSHRSVTDKAIRLKAEKDPNEYGHYSSPNSAYYVLLEYQDASKKKPVTKRVMEGIPVDISYRIDNPTDPLTLQSYLEEKYGCFTIIKAPIYKYQLISWNGGKYYMVSASEIINARQLWLPRTVALYLQTAQKALQANARFADVQAFNEWPNKRQLNHDIYVYLCEQINNYYPRYNGVYQKLTSDTTVNKFENMNENEQIVGIFSLLNMLHCNSACGLTTLSLSTSAGRYSNVNISDPTIEFINTSVTGMFES